MAVPVKAPLVVDVFQSVPDSRAGESVGVAVGVTNFSTITSTLFVTTFSTGISIILVTTSST